MLKLIVILLKLNLPCCHMWTNFVGFTPIGEVLVVSPDNDGYRCSSEEVTSDKEHI